MNKRNVFAAFLVVLLLYSAYYLLKPPSSVTNEPPSGDLRVTVFDVGQADCILVQTGTHNMLIDAGNTGQGGMILGYLADAGVTTLDILVATHPHADHIGSMAEVIRGLDSIGEIWMPDATTTTKTFERLLDAIEETNLPIVTPTVGEQHRLGEAEIRILAPAGDSYKDLNDHSIVLKVTFGERSFLFTGDAEKTSEQEQLGLSLRADVLKVGHHGSHSSTTKAYFDAVAPRYAVISCGKDNTYGHPHTETLETLRGTELYRTDRDGAVVFVTDGQQITVTTEGAS